MAPASGGVNGAACLPDSAELTPLVLVDAYSNHLYGEVDVG